MKQLLVFISIYLLVLAGVKAQSPADTVMLPNKGPLIGMDTLQKTDTIVGLIATDSISKRPMVDSAWIIQPASFSTPLFTWQVLKRNQFFDFKASPIIKEGATLKIFKGKEFVFYLLLFMLLIFAVFRQLFPKYFNDLFKVFFRTTLKQTQIREQLMQTPLPSLMLNGFFVISAGLYISFIMEYYNSNPVNDFWLLFFYTSIGLSIAYLAKFIGLKIAGWVFGIKQATEAYIFIVFIINKMIGILLLPILILLAFSKGEIFNVSLTISWCLLTGIYLYRMILSYSVIRNQIKVNPFHFFLYFLAFEIAPLLLVYRGLLVFFDVTA